MAELDDYKPGDEAGSRPPRRQSLGVFVRWETLLLLLLGGTIAFGASVSPYFLQSTNLFYICLNVGEVAIMALPLTLIVITGEIDLSVASMLGLDRGSDGGALQARLADLAGDARGRRPGHDPRRVQRLPRHSRRPAVAGGHDRNADALPRDRAGDPADGHDRRLPGAPHEHRRHPDPRHAHPVLDRVLRGAGRRLRASFSTRRRSVARSSPSAPGRKRRSSPAFASSGSSSGCTSSRGCCAGSPACCGRSGSRRPATTPGSGSELYVVTIVLLGGVSIFGGRGTISGSSWPSPSSAACRRP